MTAVPAWAVLSIPSPSQGVWHLGPLPIRAYALCIIAGVIASIVVAQRRWTAIGGRTGEVGDIAIWAVPFGLVGGRLYHVITDHDLYFGAGKRPIEALYIWNGGLGIWGAIALGALGAYIAARRRGIRFSRFADALAPGLMVAQAIGRFGNYFNQELYGKPTKLPWGLEIDPEHYPEGRTFPPGTTFHPTFLYEAIWNLLGVALLLWLEKRFKIGKGRVFAIYVMIYCAGRAWIEDLRIDDIELHDVGGFRWGVWMAIVLFLLALGYFVVVGRRHPGPPDPPYYPGRGPEEEDAEGASTLATTDEADDDGRDDDAGTTTATRTRTATKTSPRKTSTSDEQQTEAADTKTAPTTSTAKKKTSATSTAKKTPATKTTGTKATTPQAAGTSAAKKTTTKKTATKKTAVKKTAAKKTADADQPATDGSTSPSSED